MNRDSIALVGATGMLLLGAITLQEAVSWESIDYKTILLLLGMMILVAYLRLSRVIEGLATLALRHLATPWQMLAGTILASGVLSALLINDVVCLALTPLVILVARRRGWDPLPHLIALATSANIGSVCTITGNPQNIFIGSHSGISFGWFLWRLCPVTIVGLVLDFLIVALIYRQRLKRAVPHGGDPLPEPPRLRAAHRGLQIKSVGVTLITLALFFTGLPLELVALGGASALLLGKVRPERVFRLVDWGLLVMFCGLFIVVHAFQLQVVSHWHLADWEWIRAGTTHRLALLSAGLSNLVSNVPAVLLIEPLVPSLAATQQENAWLTLAMSSTLAGNFTLLGSVANLIVAENARREGVSLTFGEYLKVGVLLTIVTLAWGCCWLAFSG